MPPPATPLALMEAATLVRPLKTIVTVPPLPLPVAFAAMTAFPTVTLCATGSAPPPCRLPPIRTVPPPASPEASSLAPSATATELPRIAMVPPLSPAFWTGHIDRARYGDMSILARIQHHFAILNRCRVGLDQAGRIDDIVDDTARRARRHQHAAALAPRSTPEFETRAAGEPCASFGGCETGALIWYWSRLSPSNATEKASAPPSTT